jgi:hypothetical protein
MYCRLGLTPTTVSEFFIVCDSSTSSVTRQSCACFHPGHPPLSFARYPLQVVIFAATTVGPSVVTTSVAPAFATHSVFLARLYALFCNHPSIRLLLPIPTYKVFIAFINPSIPCFFFLRCFDLKAHTYPRSLSCTFSHCLRSRFRAKLFRLHHVKWSLLLRHVWTKSTIPLLQLPLRCPGKGLDW